MGGFGNPLPPRILNLTGQAGQLLPHSTPGRDTCRDRPRPPAIPGTPHGGGHWLSRPPPGLPGRLQVRLIAVEHPPAPVWVARRFLHLFPTEPHHLPWIARLRRYLGGHNDLVLAVHRHLRVGKHCWNPSVLVFMIRLSGSVKLLCGGPRVRFSPFRVPLLPNLPAPLIVGRTLRRAAAWPPRSPPGAIVARTADATPPATRPPAGLPRSARLPPCPAGACFNNSSMAALSCSAPAPGSSRSSSPCAGSRSPAPSSHRSPNAPTPPSPSLAPSSPPVQTAA